MGVLPQEGQCSSLPVGVLPQEGHCSSLPVGVRAQGHCSSLPVGVRAQEGHCSSLPMGVRPQEGRCSSLPVGVRTQGHCSSLPQTDFSSQSIITVLQATYVGPMRIQNVHSVVTSQTVDIGLSLSQTEPTNYWPDCGGRHINYN